MIRNIITMLLICVASHMAMAAGSLFSAAFYDGNGSFLSVADVDVEAVASEITLHFGNLSELGNSATYSPAGNSGTVFVIYNAPGATFPYMMIDNATSTLRFSKSEPASLSDFEYALSFDHGDWSRLISLLK